MRYCHLLRRARARDYPGQYAALAVDVDWVRTGGPACEEEARLVRWAVCGASGRGGHYGAAVERQGTTKEDFWEEVFHAVRKRGPIWVVCEHAAIAASVLGLWVLLEGGDIRRADTHHDPVAQAGRSPVRRAEALCLLGDVPFVLDLRRRSQPGRIRWIDWRNYGCAAIPARECAADRAGRIYSSVRRMVATLQSEELGGLRTTVAAQAWAGWRYRHLTHPVVCHDDAHVLSLEDDAHHAGRCECFRLGAVPGRVYHLDVCAQYAALIAGSDVPVGVRATGMGCPPPSVAARANQGGVLARVTLCSADRAYPWRDGRSNLVCWPAGRWTATLPGPELSQALREGAIMAWHEWAEYELAPALKSVGEHYLRLRAALATDPDLSPWAKMLANSLVGKLRARDRRWVDDFSDFPGPPWCTWWSSPEPGVWDRWRRIAGADQRQVVEGFAADAVPAAAAWITSLARMQLLGLIRCAGWEHTYYVDTDALLVDEEGYQRLCAAGHVEPGVPGKLRIKEVGDAVYVRGLRDYHIAGVHQPEQLPTRDAGVVPAVSHVEVVSGPLASLRRRQRPQALRHTALRARSGGYRHGRVKPDGRVAAHEVWEDT